MPNKRSLDFKASDIFTYKEGFVMSTTILEEESN